jgi:hypothetical protein
MNVTQFLAVNGTHENRNREQWSNPESALSKFLERHGLMNIAHSAMLPYDWSDDIDFTAGNHGDWIAGGRSFFYYVAPPLRPEYAWPAEDTVAVTHSHGLQVALYAAKLGLKIDRLLDIAGPVRKDMMPVAQEARPNIRRWMHVHSDRSDHMQWFGEFGDRHFGIVRKHPLADDNVEIEKVGHGGLLRDPKFFPLWLERGLINFLKTGAR